MDKNDRESINRFIALNHSFAVWREPNESIIHFIMQTEKTPLRSTHDLSEFDQIDGFIIAPFDLVKNKAVIIQSDCIQSSRSKNQLMTKAINTSDDVDLSQSETLFQSKTEAIRKGTLEKSFSDFTSTFKAVKQSLKQGIDKIVLAHQSIYYRPATFSPVEAFLKACEQYPSAYVHLSNTPITGVWIGATPELLLARKEGSSDYHTMALAGTQLISSHDNIEEWIKHPISLHWDAKNVREQKIVSKFISEKLSNYRGIESLNQMKPRTIKAGHLAHLQTRFDFRLPDNSSLGGLAMTLHPTPAVCGMPQESANEAIKKAEKIDRGYYAGFLGYKGATSCRFMVNLRCMNIRNEDIILWAGAGILPSSKLENEFREIELKKQIMKQLL